jgi:hypothetical protein
MNAEELHPIEEQLVTLVGLTDMNCAVYQALAQLPTVSMNRRSVG